MFESLDGAFFASIKKAKSTFFESRLRDFPSHERLKTYLWRLLKIQLKSVSLPKGFLSEKIVPVRKTGDGILLVGEFSMITPFLFNIGQRPHIFQSRYSNRQKQNKDKKEPMLGNMSTRRDWTETNPPTARRGLGFHPQTFQNQQTYVIGHSIGYPSLDVRIPTDCTTAQVHHYGSAYQLYASKCPTPLLTKDLPTFLTHSPTGTS